MDSLFIVLGIASLVFFVGSLVLLPWLVCKIPADYFIYPHHVDAWQLLVNPKIILRNLLGMLVIVAGLLMIVLPGQGVLTILIGLAIMQFPYKYELERWIVSRKGVLKALNWLRTRGKQPPIIHPDQKSLPQESKV